MYDQEDKRTAGIINQTPEMAEACDVPEDQVVHRFRESFLFSWKELYRLVIMNGHGNQEWINNKKPTACIFRSQIGELSYAFFSPQFDQLWVFDSAELPEGSTVQCASKEGIGE